MASTKIITPPTFEPVTLTDVLKFLRIDTDDDDGTFSFMISNCRAILEKGLRMALCQQTLQSVLEFDLPPSAPLSGWLDHTSGKIEIPYPPLTTVNTVSIETQPGIFTVLDPSTYYTDLESTPGMVWIQATAFQTLVIPEWTVWTEPFFPRIEVNYTCGYATAKAIPNQHKQALLELIAYKYQNREGAAVPEGTLEYIQNERVYLL